MEVNARPELKDDIIDKTVNRPMVCLFAYSDYMLKLCTFLSDLNEKTKSGNICFLFSWPRWCE